MFIIVPSSRAQRDIVLSPVLTSPLQHQIYPIVFSKSFCVLSHKTPLSTAIRNLATAKSTKTKMDTTKSRFDSFPPVFLITASSYRVDFYPSSWYARYLLVLPGSSFFPLCPRLVVGKPFGADRVPLGSIDDQGSFIAAASVWSHELFLGSPFVALLIQSFAGSVRNTRGWDVSWLYLSVLVIRQRAVRVRLTRA
ncbi:hypothetical protein K435DRAFT_867866 [Dendrothele bispora CBS 962.96]|uniref:Uncharacterized protein n=1 Tax=Dendrothele bispora (strain CBS 962.96) TaxID=1314807 RepID=A0A4S8LEI3_DENBC|nr:hypothetical protein K435DRAFT_867866 [Dendrothele bispora CBS 962.96]